MKTFFWLKPTAEDLRPSFADLVQDATRINTYVITRISVPEPNRGKGMGTKLLKMILEQADNEGVMLALDPYSSGGLTHKELVEWYKRHGFRKTGTGFMERPPHNKVELDQVVVLPNATGKVFSIQRVNENEVMIGIQGEYFYVDEENGSEPWAEYKNMNHFSPDKWNGEKWVFKK